MSHEEFAACIGLLAVQFGDPGEEKMDAYWFALHDEDPVSMLFSVHRLMREYKPTQARPFPSPQAILECMPGNVDNDTRSESAWLRVVESALNGPEAFNVATGSTPTGEDLTQEELRAIGGSVGLLQIWDASDNPERLSFIKRDFVAAYKAILTNRSAGLLPDGRPDPELVPKMMAVASSIRALQAINAPVAAVLGGGGPPTPALPEKGATGQFFTRPMLPRRPKGGQS